MNAALRRGVVSGIFAGGIVLLGVATATSASADTADPASVSTGSTDGSDGIGSGNQTVLDLEAPVRVTGDQVTVLGDDNDNQTVREGPAPSPEAAPAAEPAEAPDDATTPADTSGEDGVLSGNQTTVTACAPVTADGNQVTVVGDGNTGSSGGAHDACESATVGDSDQTSGEDGVGSGNQTSLEVCVPVTVSGNQVTGIGDDNHASGEESAATCGAGERTSDRTSGEDGAASGNQTSLDACVPVTATGNQLTVLGDGNQSESSGATSSCGDDGTTGDDAGDTSGEDGAGSGNQTVLDPTVPVEVGGNQVTVIGDGNRNESSSTGGPGGGEGAGTGDTSGEDGAGSGNQTVLDLLAPVDVTGNQVTVIGDGNGNESSSTEGPDGGEGAGTGDTSGEDGVGSGNQTVLDPTVPIDVGGNQVTVIGDDNVNESTEETSDGGDGGDGEDGPGDDPGDGDGGGDDPGVDPGGQDGGDDSPGDTDVLPGQARAGALVAAPRAPREVRAGLPATAPAVADGAGVTSPGGPTTPVLPVAMLLMGALCLALAGRRSRVGRT